MLSNGLSSLGTAAPAHTDQSAIVDGWDHVAATLQNAEASWPPAAWQVFCQEHHPVDDRVALTHSPDSAYAQWNDEPEEYRINDSFGAYVDEWYIRYCQRQPNA
ncbi:MAG TPA: hypothetical protein VLE93_03455 [Candidatus Saccharimonadales bacterium]|nr:hypothetical protein [Candidatus Saccharimonadales bacterium]